MVFNDIGALVGKKSNSQYSIVKTGASFINELLVLASMELVVLEDTKERFFVELPGLDHTFCNNLKKELYQDANVKEASYVIDHPLVGTPKFLVHTDGKKAPRAALKDACKRIEGNNKEFLAAFKKIR